MVRQFTAPDNRIFACHFANYLQIIICKVTQVLHVFHAPLRCGSHSSGNRLCPSPAPSERREVAHFARVPFKPMQHTFAPILRLTIGSPSAPVFRKAPFVARGDGVTLCDRGGSDHLARESARRCYRLRAASGLSAPLTSSSLGHHSGRSISVTRSRMNSLGASIL